MLGGGGRDVAGLEVEYAAVEAGEGGGAGVWGQEREGGFAVGLWSCGATLPGLS